MSSFPYLIFKECNSLNLCLYISEKGSYKGAARDITYTSIPGRSGDLITDNGRYKNITIPYKLTLLNNSKYEFSELAHKIKGWLLSESGYFRLWDSYDKKYFRLASYSDEADIEQELHDLGSLSLSFECKPFKYSFEGQNAVEFTATGELYNAEHFPSLPYIKIIAAGAVTLYINNTAVSFSDIDEYIEIDSEMMNAYKNGVSQNNKMISTAFPTLSPGVNSISWVGNVEKVIIIPRWCCL